MGIGRRQEEGKYTCKQTKSGENSFKPQKRLWEREEQNPEQALKRSELALCHTQKRSMEF